MEGAPQFPALIEEDGARLLKPVSYVTTGSHETFELMDDSWEEPNFLILAVLPVQRCS